MILAMILLAILLMTALIFFLVRRRRTVKLTRDEYNLYQAKKFGRFEIRSFLVRGDFNTTFEAYDPEKNKIVALRILDRKYLLIDSIIAQFLQKGELLKFLSEKFTGDHFVQDVRFGVAMVNEEQRQYIATDYTVGVSLGQVLDRYGKLSPSDAWTIVGQVAESVRLAHAERIWFREFAPRNILLTINKAGQLSAVIANVGVAYGKLPTEYWQNSKKGYYSPEDIRGDEVDERSDVYALAALLFRMLEGYEVSSRGERDRWIGSTALLIQALSADPEKRPPTVEKFIASVGDVRKSGSRTRNLRWDAVLPAMARSGKQRTVKPSNTDEIVPKPPVFRIGPVKPTNIGWAVAQAATTAFILWVGRKVETVLSSPKKFAAMVGGGIVAMGVGLWLLLIGVSGEIRVIVFEQGPREKRIPAAEITLELVNAKSEQLVDVEFDHRDAGTSIGKITVKARRSGFLLVDYKGNFKREDVLLRVTAKDSNHVAGLSNIRLLERNATAPLYLKPLRRGEIRVRFDDPGRLIGPGNLGPTFVSYKLYATDANGNPSPSAQFWMNEEMLPSVGTGSAQSKKVALAMGTAQQISYRVEDKAKVSLEVRPEGGAPGLEFESLPQQIEVTSAKMSSQVKASLKKSPGSDNETYTFVVKTADGNVWDGIEVFLSWLEGWKSIGKTDRNGRLEYPVSDTKSFWATKPRIRLDLRRYNTDMRFSREYALRQGEGREIPVIIEDVQ